MKKFVFDHYSEKTAFYNKSGDYRFYIDCSLKGDRLITQKMEKTAEQNAGKSEWATVRTSTLVLIGVMYYVPDEDTCLLLTLSPFSTERHVLNYLNEIGGYEKLNELQQKNFTKIFGKNIILNQVIEEGFTMDPVKNVQISVRFDLDISDRDNGKDKLTTCYVTVNCETINVFPVLKALNTKYNLTKLEEIFKNGGNIVIRGTNCVLGKFPQKRDEFYKLMGDHNIEPVNTQPPPPAPKAPILNVRKGDKVSLFSGVIGEIVKYPSNKEIHLQLDDKSIQIISKEEIEKVL